MDVIHPSSWSLSKLPDIIEEIKSKKPDIVHMQYPTLGYGFKLVPHLLSIYFPTLITLHEVSQVNILRQLSLYLFSKKSNHFLFTNVYEKDYALKHAPWIEENARVIPIGSNIPRGKEEKEENGKEILYFGLIREKKGLEEVIELARLIKEAGEDYQIRIIGKPDSRSAAYLERLIEEAKDLPVIWDLGKEAEEVADRLSRSRMGYLPFPDGASERRGSLLAFLLNQVHTITTRGPFTPDIFDEVVEYASTPEEAFQQIQSYFSRDTKEKERESEDFGTQYLWEDISRKHLALYQEILAKR